MHTGWNAHHRKILINSSAPHFSVYWHTHKHLSSRLLCLVIQQMIWAICLANQMHRHADGKTLKYGRCSHRRPGCFKKKYFLVFCENVHGKGAIAKLIGFTINRWAIFQGDFWFLCKTSDPVACIVRIFTVLPVAIQIPCKRGVIDIILWYWTVFNIFRYGQWIWNGFVSTSRLHS